MTVTMDGKTVLRDAEYRAICHALGLQKKGGRGRFSVRWAYRNYFDAGAADLPTWERLEGRGLAVRAKVYGTHSGTVFCVTWRGMDAANVRQYVGRSLRLSAPK